MRRLTAVVVASLALVACGGGGDDETADDGETISIDEIEDMQEAVDNASACEELYAEGNVLEDGQWQEPCEDADGEVRFFGTASEECADGRKLLWNDAAWWFEGEGVNPHPEGSDAGVPPDSAYQECSAS